MRYLKALFVLALGLCLTAPAYAETQNVKVSGAIDAYWFYRSNFDLRDNNDVATVPAGTAVPAGGGGSGNAVHRTDAADYARTNTQLEVAADLTDNVSTVVNLVNQRDWNATTFDGGAANTGAEFDVELDLAYVKMKEIFYSPLTLTVGRQDIWLGRGFIIGNNNTSWDHQGNTEADEYSVTTAFDALRATLDFNPWTIDLVWSNINELGRDNANDRQLYVANVNYKFAEYNAVAEGYVVGENDRSQLSGATGTKANNTSTYGARVQFDPISQITLGGEYAYQTGSYQATVSSPDRDRGAWALDLFGTYRFDYTWKPELTLEYVVFSGEPDVTAGSTQSYGAWNALYRGKFWTAYADFREFTYATSDPNDQAGSTNVEFIQLAGTMKPLQDLLLYGGLTFLRNNESILAASTDIGYEADVQATYDYTEDVSFSVLAAWFVPGGYYASPNDKTASELVSSVKVAF